MNHDMTYAFGRLMSVVAVAAVTMATVALTGCSSDDEPGRPADDRTDRLQLLAYAQPMTDLTPTRATVIDGVTVPDDYIPYSKLKPRPLPAYATIGVFMTSEIASTRGTFTYLGPDSGYSGDDSGTPYEWSSTIYVQEDVKYWLYGIMPEDVATSVTVSPLGSADSDGKGYAAGAKLSLKGMPLIAPSDPCVVVGVEDVAYNEVDGHITPKSEGSVELGKFAFMGKKKRRNFVRLLLDHLYSGVHFLFQVDDTYSELRTIKLRKVEMKSDLYGTIDCDITLTANSSNTAPLAGEGSVTFSNEQTGTSSAVVFEGDKLIPSVAKAATEGQLGVLACFAPAGSTVGQHLSIVVTYDVYDMDGTCIRKGVEAENKLPTIPEIGRGALYKLTLTVNPTYLYQLSDPDLDNPTITIANP